MGDRSGCASRAGCMQRRSEPAVSCARALKRAALALALSAAVNAAPVEIASTGDAPARSQGASASPQVLTSEYELHEPTNSTRNQQYGGQVALSADGRTMVVADVWYFGGAQWPWYGSGAVYVYARTNETWVLEAKLQPPDARGYDFFGSDVALSADGDTLAIGAQGEGHEAPTQNSGPGSVFVFTRRGAAWTQEAMLRAVNPQDAASFGRSVEMSASGDVVAVGAPYATAMIDVSPAPGAGAVYVFEKRDAVWLSQAALRAPNPQSDDQFGLGVRLSGDGLTICILAAEQNYATEDVVNGGWPNRNNTVYVFGRVESAWNLQAEFEGSSDDPMFAGTSYEPVGQV
ncbi:MAG TPA: FG-GAP repeat protein, partial [Steroidobacter sp.]|nr:FG-GAP repeat protein [Steroidobacter sp.]